MSKDEINAMLDALQGDAKLDDPPNTEPPVEDDVKTDPPSTDPPQDEAVTDPPIDDDQKTDAPTTEEPADDQYAELMKKNKELEDKLNEFTAKTDPPSTNPPPDTLPPIEVQDFLGEDIDVEEVTRDSKSFNELLNKVFEAGIQHMRTEMGKVAQDTMVRVPGLVKETVTVQEDLRKMSEEFYEGNEDLVPWKKTVGVVFDELFPQHSNKTYKEILDLVGPEVRNRLGLKKGQKPSDNDDPPNLPRKKGKKRVVPPKPKPGSLRSEIDEMNQALNT